MDVVAQPTEGPRARGDPVPKGRGIARREGFGQPRRESREAQAKGGADQAFAKISEALCPPKPIELESAVVMLLARAVFGT